MLYPLLFWFNRRSVGATFAGVVVVSLLLGLGYKTGFLLFDRVGAYLFAWWLGALAADILSGRVRIGMDKLSALVTALIVIPVRSLLKLPDVIVDNLVAIGFFGLLMLLFTLRERGTSLAGIGKLKWIGDYSYTLYVIHVPILVLLNGIVLKSTDNRMPPSFLYMWPSIFGCIAVAYGLHFLTEKPFSTSLKGKTVEPSFSAAS